MPPLPVVEDLEVIEQLGARRRPRGPRRVVDELDLQRREETLGHGVVPTIAPAAHAAHDPVLGQDALVVAAGVLTAAIGMMEQPLRRAPARPGDLETQPFVRPRARCRRARLPGVEARARHLERAAEHPHWEDGLLRGDEPESHGFSFAKKAVAFFRMSRSIRSVRFSRRSRPSSSRSAVVSAPGAPRPASISACRTQLRSAVSVRSSSRATAPMAFPLSRTTRTACALNSFVNARRFRLAMTHSSRTFVRSEVSTKSGQVQAVSARI